MFRIILSMDKPGRLVTQAVFYCAIYLLAIAPINAANAMEIKTALGLLLIEHPGIKSAEKIEEANRSGIGIAKSGFYPTINITADTGPQRIDNPTTRANGEDYSRSKQVTTLTITQNLFNGNFTTSSVRTAQLNTLMASLELERSRQSILFEGITAYIDVLRQQRLVDLGRENVDNIQHQLNLEDERVRRGSGITIDVLEAKSRLQIAKERLVSFEGAMINAMTRYNQVFGRMANPEAMQDPWPPVSLIPGTLEEAIAIALRENPNVTGSTANIEGAREQRRSAASSLFPSVGLEGTVNYEKNNDTTLGIRRDYMLFLRASWDLFSGYSTSSSMDKTFYEYRAKIDDHAFIERKVAEQVHLAWQSLLTTRTRVSLLENAVNIASEVYASRVKLREVGNETIINVLDAQNQVTSAQINYTSTAYNERLATYQLLLAMGRLTADKLNLPQP